MDVMVEILKATGVIVLCAGMLGAHLTYLFETWLERRDLESSNKDEVMKCKDCNRDCPERTSDAEKECSLGFKVERVSMGRVYRTDNRLLFEDGRLYVTRTPMEHGIQSGFPEKTDVTMEVARLLRRYMEG